MYRCQRCLQRVAIHGVRFQSTTAGEAPPLMAKIKSDLKAAMKAKDTVRLNVIKSVISEVNNAAKSSSPITSDVRLLAILRKKSALSRDAAKQFAEAKREDLQSKENAQADVLDEYASEVKLMGEEDVENAINEAIEKLKASTATLKPQDILKTLFGAGGAFDGKPVDRGLVAKKVSTLLKPQ